MAPVATSVKPPIVPDKEDVATKPSVVVEPDAAVSESTGATTPTVGAAKLLV